jgi:hypothetical protein
VTKANFAAPLGGLLGALALLASPTTPLHATPDDTLGVALMSAIVDSQGHLLSGSGATAAARTSQGQYTVTFVRDVSACTFAATSTFQGEMIGASAGSSANVAMVYSMSPSGGGSSVSDSGFNLVVFCAQ